MRKSLPNLFLCLALTFALASGCNLTCSSTGDTQKAESVASQELTAAVKTVSLDIEGMTCAGCEYNVETALKKIDGVASVKASIENSVAAVVLNDQKITTEQLVAAVNELGYKAKAQTLD